jgi:hypothetical protein
VIITDGTLIKTDDDEEPCTWAAFVAANTTGDADEDEWIADAKHALEWDGEYWGGGGAAAEFHISLW